MKKKIVITIEESETGWSGNIQGIVGNKRTDKIESSKIPQLSIQVIDQLSTKVIQIEKWMEQIS